MMRVSRRSVERHTLIRFTITIFCVMKSDVLIRITVLAAVAIGSAQFWGCTENAGAAGNPPKLMIVGGDSVNWGEVGGGELKHTLKLVNVGGDTLKITEVKPSCGCTTAPIDKDVLLSGDTATISLKMDVHGRIGRTMKTLRISSNDSTSPTKTVMLKANVVQAVIASPAYFHISDVAAGQEGSSTVELKNIGKEPVTIQPPKEENVPLMAIRFSMLKPVTLQPSDSVAVTVYATPLNTMPAPVHFTFTTDSKLTPEVHVPLSVVTKADSPTGVAQSPQVGRH